MKYPSDMTAFQWGFIEDLLPLRKGGGRPPKYEDRSLVNAILYLTSNRIKWRSIPNDCPHWCSVYKYFVKLTELGVWEKINREMVSLARYSQDRNDDPSLICIDSQSVKGDCVNEESGFDGYKKVKGIKRHILTDILGLIVMCAVTTANASDVKTGKEMVSQISKQNLQPRLKIILADRAYKTLCEGTSINLEISSKDSQIKAFKPLRIRWKVERSFAWLGRKRRLNRNYERKLEHHKQFIYIANTQQALKIISS